MLRIKWIQRWCGAAGIPSQGHQTNLDGRYLANQTLVTKPNLLTSVFLWLLHGIMSLRAVHFQCLISSPTTMAVTFL